MNIKPLILPIGPSIAYIPLSKGKFALIDAQDLETASRFNWYASRQTSGISYARRSVRIGCKNHRSIGLQTTLLTPSDDMIVDHINGNTLDNRRINLRLATKHQNAFNRGIASNNTSGVKGVSRHMQTGMWRADINLHRKQIHLGLFDTLEDAATAYKKAAKRFFGDFARAETWAESLDLPVRGEI